MGILEVKGLTKSFGGVMAVAGVDLNVKEGTIHCIIGPNGAGKTTLFNLISGYYKCDGGEVIFRGKNITGWNPEKILKLGLARSFQVTKIFPGLTVYENVQVPVLFNRGAGLNFFSDAGGMFKDIIDEILSMVGLGHKAHEPAGLLAAGDRKRLEMGIVLATDPKLLLLDEPTCGMSPHETSSTIDLIKRIADQKNLTVLFTEHKMDVIFSIASRITVMNFGSVIAEGQPEEIRCNEDVQRIYFGDDRCFSL